MNLTTVSTFLNKNYNAKHLKEHSANEIVEMAFATVIDIRSILVTQPPVVLNGVKSELDMLLKHHLRIATWIEELNSQIEKIVDQGPKVLQSEVNQLDAFEAEKTTLVNFVWAIEEVISTYIHFLTSYFSKDEIEIDFIKKFASFLPKEHRYYNYSQEHRQKTAKKNLEAALQEMNEIQSISGRLDFWANEYFYKFRKKSTYFDLAGNEYPERQSEYNRSNLAKLISDFFGVSSLYSPALIPAEIYDVYFQGGLEDPEFTNWFLHFNAQIWFEDYYKARFKKKLDKSITPQLIKAELYSLGEFEREADMYLELNKYDPYKECQAEGYREYHLWKRIQVGYFEKEVLRHPHILGGNSAVDIHAKHSFFKPWLEAQLQYQSSEEVLAVSKEIETECRRIIESGDLEGALDFLKAKAEKSRNKEMIDNVTMLFFQFNDGKKRKLIGVDSDKDFQKNNRKIAYAILQLIGEVK